MYFRRAICWFVRSGSRSVMSRLEALNPCTFGSRFIQ